MGINLGLCVWKKFFKVFYGLSNRYRDRFICQLLGRMNQKGSRTKPDLDTFRIIIQGIAGNPGIQDAESLIDLIVSDIMPSHNISADRHHQIHRIQFAVSEKKGNVDRIIVLIEQHPEIAFVHETVTAFDRLLTELTPYVAAKNHQPFFMKSMSEHIMQRQRIRFTQSLTSVRCGGSI